MSLQTSLESQKILNLVDQSTEMYWQNNYQACVALLNDCILLQPQISALFSNRAIAYYHLKQKQNSLLNLKKSIQINHLNFIAYFNLFSFHFLDKNNEESFQNLCLCLSSAYTYLCRSQKQLKDLNKSLYYSYNNKQSIFLKGILFIQKNQLRQSLQLFKQTQQLQNKKLNQKMIGKYIRKIQKIMNINEQKTISQYKTKNSIYVLKTDVACPQQEDTFHETILMMLRQFNHVYRKLIESNIQIDIQTIQPPYQDLKSDNSLKDKQSIKTRNNTMIQLDNNSISQCQKEIIKNQSNISNIKDLNSSSFVNNQSINHVSVNKQNQMNKSILKFQFVFQKLKLNPKGLENINFSNLYLLILPNPNHNRSNWTTNLVKTSNGECSWSTQPFILDTQQRQLIKIRILNKRFRQFEDELIGEIQLDTINIGYFSLPFNKDGQSGILRLKIEQSQ